MNITAEQNNILINDVTSDTFKPQGISSPVHNEPKYSGSIICMNPNIIGETIKAYDSEMSSWHFDLMDGQIPYRRFGIYPEQIKACKKISNKPIEVHAMVKDIYPYLEMLADYGTDIVSFHIEDDHSLYRTIDRIHELNMKASIVLNLQSNFEYFHYELFNSLDMIEFMSINPGHLGTKVRMNIVLDKVAALKFYIKNNPKITNTNLKFGIDGGVRWDTIDSLLENGITHLVCGSMIFNDYSNIEDNIKKLSDYKNGKIL